MLTPAEILADAQEIDPAGLIVFGSVCCLVAAYLCAAAFSPSIRAYLRWGEDGRGPQISAAGAGAFSASALLFGLALFARAFAQVDVARFLEWLIFTTVVLAVLISIRDYRRDRERI